MKSQISQRLQLLKYVGLNKNKCAEKDEYGGISKDHTYRGAV
jgi:hypothetical protein